MFAEYALFLRYSHSWRSGPVSESNSVRVGIPLVQDSAVPSIKSNSINLYENEVSVSVVLLRFSCNHPVSSFIPIILKF
jgi:hypothetical protein